MTIKGAFGKRGEEIAKNYLTGSGYTILKTNYRLGHLEMDIIAAQKNKLIFVEVKTRARSTNSETDNLLNPQQVTRLKRLISAYCYKVKHNPDLIRLDLIVILVNRANGRAELIHYHDVS